MATSYTSILKLALPATGELAGTWGDVVNDNITSMVEEAIAGLATINTWAGASHTLTTANGTTSESRCAILELSGTPGAAASVICPDASKIYIVRNDVTGGFAATIKTASGTGVTIPNGKVAAVYCDGTNVVAATEFFSSVDIDGGTIDGTAIGGSSPAAGAFTTLSSNSTTTLNGTTIPASKTLVDTDTAQTLTNKTLTSPTITGTGTAAFGNLSYTGTLTGSTGVLNIGSGQIYKDASGNLGLGTSSPGAKLDVNGTAAFAGATTFNGGANTLANMGELQWKDSGGTAQNVLYMFSDNNIYLSSPVSGASLIFRGVGYAERMRIDSSGNVGIGTSSPIEKFQLLGGKVLASGSYGSSSSVIGTYIGESTDGNLFAEVDMRRWTGAATNHGVSRIATDDSGNMRFYTDTKSTNTFATTERMRITSSGNVGIGTSSPSQKLHVSGGSQFRAEDASWTFDSEGSSRIGFVKKFGFFTTLAAASGAPLTFSTSNSADLSSSVASQTLTERARIDSSGNLLVGTTSTTPNPGIALQQGFNAQITIGHDASSGSGQYYLPLYFNGGLIGGITQNGTTAVSYNTSSDYRLKTDIQPMTNAIARLMQLEFVNYAWLADGSRADGVIAHKAQEVVPQAVTGKKDEVDKDGKPVYQGVDYSKLVPLVSAALQEAVKRIEQLEAQLNSGA